MSCPLGWNCAEMGLNPSGIGCMNKGKCSAIAKTLHNETHPNPDAVDALDYGNPYLSWEEQGKYWRVYPYRVREWSSKSGYAVAKNANLP